MLATLTTDAFDDSDWIFEVKWDGYRALALTGGDSPVLLSRQGLDVSRKYPDIVRALQKFKHSAVIDGELVALDERGVPRFQFMQRPERAAALVYYAFDLLFLDGEDLRGLPLIKRKRRLRKILPRNSRVRFSSHVNGRGEEFFELARQQGLEGIVAKRAESPYLSGVRSKDWLKIKSGRRQEAVVIGFTAPRGTRRHVGSLLLAVRDGDHWRYVGHTGGGFGMPLKALYERLQPFVQTARPIQEKVPDERSVTWLKPKLVCEVAFTEWTDDGRMRHPVFLGFRDDKPSTRVVMEGGSAATSRSADPALTNLEKVFWPEEGYRKGDVIA